MDKTFPIRINFIVNGIHPMMDIKQKYPFLFSGAGIRTEFARLTEFDVKERFLYKLSTVQEKFAKLSEMKNENEGKTE